MPAKNLLERLTVVSPCSSSWDEMTGNDQVRFCTHCNLNVNNLSEMTHTQAVRLVAKSKGRLCVRYYRTASGEIRTVAPSPARLVRRRLRRIAAGAFGAALGISTAGTQTSAATMNASPSQQVSYREVIGAGTILVGVIRDANGAVIAGATISISNADHKVALYNSTDDSGEFRFTGLLSGYYQFRVEAQGFMVDEFGYYLPADEEVRIDRTLTVDGPKAEVEIESVYATTGLVAFVAPADPFIKAALEDDVEAVERLIAGRDVNLRDKKSGTTALEHAVENGNREMVQLLISKGADVNATNSVGQHVLMMLDSDGTADLVWDLINAGAKLELQDQSGDTALTEAAAYDNVEVLRTLIEAGADVNATTRLGETPLMKAASNGSINNVRLLVLAGASLNACDKQGRNALAFAIEHEHRSVIRFLKSRGVWEQAAKTDENK